MHEYINTYVEAYMHVHQRFSKFYNLPPALLKGLMNFGTLRPDKFK
jgi:hypothetical protein